MLANLRALLGGLIDIILLRRGPDNLPSSPALLGIVVAVYAAVNALLTAALSQMSAKWPLALGLSIAFTLLWYHVTLNRARKPERFVQTMTAMFGVATLFAPVILPMVSAVVSQSKDADPASAPLALGVLFVCIWAIVINVSILRAALEWPGIGAFGLFVAQNFAWVVLALALFGGPTPAPAP